MNKNCLIIVFLIGCFFPIVSNAWGRLGHQITCDIAFRALEPKTKREVIKLLKMTSDRTFAQMCTWADQVRERKQYKHTKKLHYINVPRRARQVKNTHCDAQGCVLSAIHAFQKILEESTHAAARIEALRWLGHLVADIHQPLHVSYKDDRGGNDVKVWFKGKRMNLHQLWDRDLITQDATNWRTLGEQIAMGIEAKQRVLWQRQIEPLQWANESLTITRTLIYPRLRRGSRYNQFYFDACSPIVLDRLRKGGIRLAAILDRVFSSSPKARNR
jgi:hypothetical protein